MKKSNGAQKETICNHFMVWNIQGGYSYYRCDKCNYIDGKKTFREPLLDQLYRFEGILGKYNCQHGGTECKFQINCHRLLREEIGKLKEKEIK